jgi:hypothetical protein
LQCCSSQRRHLPCHLPPPAGSSSVPWCSSGHCRRCRGTRLRPARGRRARLQRSPTSWRRRRLRAQSTGAQQTSEPGPMSFACAVLVVCSLCGSMLKEWCAAHMLLPHEPCMSAATSAVGSNVQTQYPALASSPPHPPPRAPPAASTAPCSNCCPRARPAARRCWRPSRRQVSGRAPTCWPPRRPSCRAWTPSS